MTKTYKITDVRTVIINKVQKVEFRIDNSDTWHQTDFATLNDAYPKLSITKIEALIGADYNETFYNNGETMGDGKSAFGNKVLKSWNITFTTNYEDALELNKDKFREFQMIFRLTIHSKKDGKDPFAIIKGSSTTTFGNLSELTSITGLKQTELHLLEGSLMTFDCYNEGDWLEDRMVKVQNSNRILKNPIVRTPSNLEESNQEYLKSDIFISRTLSGDNYPRRSGDPYGQYGGPSDGYGGYLDDDFINDALGGDPDAIWNID